MLSQTMFVHHVYFWLNKPGDKEDHKSLLLGLQGTLSTVPGIKAFHIGIPADTHRDVIDSSYALSWLAVFDNKEDQDAYQIDPIHLKFIDDCKHLWSRVLVYDSIGAF